VLTTRRKLTVAGLSELHPQLSANYMRWKSLKVCVGSACVLPRCATQEKAKEAEVASDSECSGDEEPAAPPIEQEIAAAEAEVKVPKVLRFAA
jgi:hypothetical protein